MEYRDVTAGISWVQKIHPMLGLMDMCKVIDDYLVGKLFEIRHRQTVDFLRASRFIKNTKPARKRAGVLFVWKRSQNRV